MAAVATLHTKDRIIAGVSVSDTEKGPKRNQYVYKIDVTGSDGTTQPVYHTAGDFTDLHKTLEKKFKPAGAPSRIPPFPLEAKRPLPLFQTFESACNKQEPLNKYCQALLKLPSTISEDVVVLSFFGQTPRHGHWVDSQETRVTEEDTYICIKTFTGKNSDELTVEEGCVVQVLRKQTSQWWKCRSSSGEGLVPAASLTKLDSKKWQSTVKKYPFKLTRLPQNGLADFHADEAPQAVKETKGVSDDEDYIVPVEQTFNLPKELSTSDAFRRRAEVNAANDEQVQPSDKGLTSQGHSHVKKDQRNQWQPEEVDSHEFEDDEPDTTHDNEVDQANAVAEVTSTATKPLQKLDLRTADRKEYVTTTDRTTAQEGHLSFRKGEIAHVPDVKGRDVFVEIDGKQGWVSASHIEEKPQTRWGYFANATMSSRETSYLDVCEGQQLKVLEKGDDKWKVEAGGKEGLVPAIIIEKRNLSETTHDDAEYVTTCASSETGCLSFTMGERVKLCEDYDGHRWMKINGQLGWVPIASIKQKTAEDTEDHLQTSVFRRRPGNLAPTGGAPPARRHTETLRTHQMTSPPPVASDLGLCQRRRRVISLIGEFEGEK